MPMNEASEIKSRTELMKSTEANILCVDLCRGGDVAIKNDVNEFKRIYKTRGGGVAGCIQYVNKKQEDWKKLPLNIAIIGNSGVGKSSFINAVRDMTVDDNGAAAVDVVEGTRTINSYSHPDYPHVRFWDLPGVGGLPEFSTGIKYLQKISVDLYDFFLLVSDSRYGDNDLWLAKEIKKRSKTFYFVRTKVWPKVVNDMKQGRATSEQQVLDTIRQAIKQNLRLNGLEDARVFLIDNYEPNKFDFEKLEQSLMADIPQLKELALMMSVSESDSTSNCTIL